MVKVITTLEFPAILSARERIQPYIHRTVVLTSSRLNEASKASLFFKCENFQKIGAFKARGATNAVFSLDDATARHGVATHSSGNHGAAVARAAKSMRPSIKVIAAEPAHADDAAQSVRAERVIHTEKKFTIADGLRTNVGEPNFAVIRRYVDDIVTVSEEAIISAMRTIWETMKTIIEPSAAVPYAAIQEGKIDVAGKRVGIVISGGNVDLDALPWMTGQ